MTPEQETHLRAWIADLEAHPDLQGKYTLHNPKTGLFCCLGRACVVAGLPEHRGGTYIAPGGGIWVNTVTQEWLRDYFGIPVNLEVSFIDLNDHLGDSFTEIAAYLRTFLPPEATP